MRRLTAVMAQQQLKTLWGTTSAPTAMKTIQLTYKAATVQLHRKLPEAFLLAC